MTYAGDISPVLDAPTAIRWSSREGALAPDRIETSPASVSIRSLAFATRPRNSDHRPGAARRTPVTSGPVLDPPTAIRWSSREGALAPDRIETSPASVSIRSLALATRPPNSDHRPGAA